MLDLAGGEQLSQRAVADVARLAQRSSACESGRSDLVLRGLSVRTPSSALLARRWHADFPECLRAERRLRQGDSAQALSPPGVLSVDVSGPTCEQRTRAAVW